MKYIVSYQAYLAKYLHTYLVTYLLEVTLSKLNRICGEDWHVFYGVRIPKRRLLVTANIRTRRNDR